MLCHNQQYQNKPDFWAERVKENANGIQTR